MRISSLIVIAFVLVSACGPDQQEKQKTKSPIYVGSIERLDPRINELIAEEAQIELLASGFQWSEGPLWLAEMNALIFTDVSANTAYKWTEGDSISKYLKPSGYFGEEENKKEAGANGLALDLNGQL